MTIPATFVPHAGGCRCGQVRFSLSATPIITLCCHCRFCQKLSGSAFRIAVMIEAENLCVLAGEPVELAGQRVHKVLRCAACGHGLWSHHSQLGDAIAFIGAGMLDRGEELPPEVHYFTRSKHPWVHLPAGIPAFAERGDPGKPAAAARIAAALQVQTRAGTSSASLAAWARGAP